MSISLFTIQDIWYNATQILLPAFDKSCWVSNALEKYVMKCKSHGTTAEF